MCLCVLALKMTDMSNHCPHAPEHIIMLQYKLRGSEPLPSIISAVLQTGCILFKAIVIHEQGVFTISAYFQEFK